MHFPKTRGRQPTATGPGENGFNPAAVSEVVWSQWRASVVKHGLGGEKLGRFAPSLQHMTRVIWNTPLESYTRYTLGEIRAMKTHGEKRIRAILEVFHSLHGLVANMGVQAAPRGADRPPADRRGRAMDRAGPANARACPSQTRSSSNFVSPLLEQVRTDATQQIASLAENRLGIPAPITSVRQAARAWA